MQAARGIELLFPMLVSKKKPNITPVPVKIKTWVCTPWSDWLVCAQFAPVAEMTPHARARGLLSAHAAAQSALSQARGVAGEG